VSTAYKFTGFESTPRSGFVQLAVRQFAGCGQTGAAIMSLIQSTKLNGHDTYAYLKDVLARLTKQRNSMIGELLPHRWAPPT
jgi:IS66 C-terminal element